MVLLCLAAAAVLGIGPPAPLTGGAAADRFSAARAFRHVERVAAGPHPVGSAAADAVRQYVVGELNGLGLRTEVQDAVGLTRGPSLARVRNVIAVLPGTASTGRLLLTAHYDSVRNGPGAGDDGSGVAAVLETVRALRAGPPLRNDVVVLVTDAEEEGLCGAEAFLSQHPLGAGRGVVLNIDTRGSSGPAVMFQTSPGNAALAAVYADAAPHPVATSVAVEVYRRLPNDTDFTEFLRTGRYAGLNTANIDGAATYHTPQDTPARLDLGTLQALGDDMLGTARVLAGADIAALTPPAPSDAVYFPVLGRLLVLPGWSTWPLALAAVLAVAALGLRAARTGAARRGQLAGAVGLALVPLAASPLAAVGAGAALEALRPEYADMLDFWHPGPYRLAMLMLAATVLLAWYAVVRRVIGPTATAFGVLVWAAVAGVAAAALAPGGSYLGSLPALAGGAALSVALGVRRPWVRTAVAAAGPAVAVLVLAPAVALFLPALGRSGVAAAVLLAALLGALALPGVERLLPVRRGAAWLPAACLLVAVGLFGAGPAVDRFAPDRPAPAQLMYALDLDTAQARWLNLDRRPGPWARQFVTAREDVSALYPALDGEVATGPAAAVLLPGPGLDTVSDVRGGGGERTLTLRLRAGRPAEILVFRVDGDAPMRATVAGRAVDASRITPGPFGVTMAAPPPGGIEVTLVFAAGAAAPRVWTAAVSFGLAGLPGFVPRPPGTDLAPSAASDALLVSRTYPLGP